ncbi:MAG: isopentenyl phosphate kinase family protein [Candidatus Pacebacteria bacterium]|nr:isopentenyl phosphate kinase family protein [Candidatus Paceibacterota bacterium]
MKKNNLIILKIGGSVITDKEHNRKRINKKNLRRIAKEIAQAKNKNGFSLIIVHGAGTFGHKIAKKFNLHQGYKNNLQIKAISDLCLDLKKLNIEVIKYLKKEGIEAITFKQSSAWQLSNGRLENYNLEIIRNYLSLNLTPVLFGDILVDKKLKFSILSGDQIIYRLAKKLTVNKVIVGTDIDGIFNCNPKTNKRAKLIKKVNGKNINNFLIENSTSIDVTRGMNGKVCELINLAKSGTESEIINITKSNILKKALLGQNGLGTIIKTN